MSIRPIDMQLTVNNGAEVVKMNTNESTRPQVQQHRFSEQAVKQSETLSKTIVQTKESENSGIDKDGKGNGSNYSKRRKRKNIDNNEKGKEKIESESQSIFDISI